MKTKSKYRMSYIRPKRLKCKNCGQMMGTIGIPECVAGPVACEWIPATSFEDEVFFTKMEIQDIMWRYASAENRDLYDLTSAYRQEVSRLIDRLLERKIKQADNQSYVPENEVLAKPEDLKTDELSTKKS